MKKILLMLFLITFPVLSMAEFLNSIDEALSAQEKILHLAGTYGVNSIGIGSCTLKGIEAKSGQDSVYCLVVLINDLNSAKALLMKYPLGTKIDDVFVFLKGTNGIVVPYPRMTGGN